VDERKNIWSQKLNNKKKSLLKETSARKKTAVKVLMRIK